MSSYEPTIGLEIHVELKTKTKMFCKCLNDSKEKHPNVNVCPVCMGHPGTLPVINEDAVRKVLIVGKALGGNLANYSQFDRKNYFYPDLPKGYQISQYKYPLVEGGRLRGVEITRIHLEEDTAKLLHGNSGESLVDFNRAGLPLMELVTEPVIKSPGKVRDFAEELQLILRYLGASDADMEKGQMRVEANISLSSEGSDKLGTKVEIKNLNSFRVAERAIAYEIERQAEVLDNGDRVHQETRGWDEDKQKTFSQREKEESHDYRYFPEPDLPSLQLTDFNAQLPTVAELPQGKRDRFKLEYRLKDEQISVFIQNKKLADYFESVVSELLSENKAEVGESRVDESANKVDQAGFNGALRLAVNYILTDLQGLVKEKSVSFEDILITPENFAELIKMIHEEKITSRVGKDVLRVMIESGRDPSVIVEERGLSQSNDEEVVSVLAAEIVKENPGVVDEYRSGKEASLQFLIGQGMKKTQGSMNPKVLKEYLIKSLK